MVHLSVYSTKNGVRYFPHKGYLGLTPVKVEGLVRTKIDSDGKTLPASSITVALRCFEARVGRTGIVSQRTVVEVSQTLWSKPAESEYADIGELELPFRITLPVDSIGFSTATFVEYRCCWKVEAVLNHIPIIGVGVRQIKSFDLPLIRYSIPKEPPALPITTCNKTAFKPFRQGLDYCICIPPASYGPLDLIPVVIRLRCDNKNAYLIRGATVAIERRISFKSASLHLSPSPDPFSEQTSSLADDASDNSIFTTSDTRPLIPAPAPIPAISAFAVDGSMKPIATPITAIQSSGEFSYDQHGVLSKTLTLKWPDTKSNSRWAVGETVQSDFASIRFFARVKITLSTGALTEVVELPEHEISIIPTNEAQRQLAISKAIEEGLMSVSNRSSRGKSSAPETSSAGSVTQDAGRDRPRDQTRTEPSSAGILPTPTPRRSSNRRPHTSAGLRDTLPGLVDRHEATSRRVSSIPSPPQLTESGRHSAPVKPPFTKWRGSIRTTPPAPLRIEPSSSNTSASSPESAITQHVRAWEEELARIEAQSRRSSARMFGFSVKRRSGPPLQDVSCL